MTVSGYSTNGISGTPGPQYNRFYDYNVDVYHNDGNHQFRVGADFRQQTRSSHAGKSDGNSPSPIRTSGSMTTPARNGNYNPATLGLSWADFMMGLPTGASVSNNASYPASNQFWASFMQDTWRVTSRLTLTHFTPRRVGKRREGGISNN